MLPLEDTAEVVKKPSNPLDNQAEVQANMIKLGIKDANRAISEFRGDDTYNFSKYQQDTLKQNAIEGARIIADLEKYAIKGLNIGNYILGKSPSVFSKELENVENIEKELVASHKEIQDRQNLYSNQYDKWGKVGLLATDMAQNVFLDPSDYVFGVATGVTKATRLMAKLPFVRYVYNQYDVYERTPLDYDYNDAKQVGIMAGLTGLKFIPSAFNHFNNKATAKAGNSGTIKDTKFLEWIDGKDKGFYPSPITILTENAKRINYDKLQERELVNVDTDYMRSIAFREDNNLPLSIYSNDAVKATSANINDTFEVYFMKVQEWQEETGEKDFPSFNDFKAFVDQVNVDYPLPLKKSIDKGTFTEDDYNVIIGQVTGYKTQLNHERDLLKTFRGYLEDVIREEKTLRENDPILDKEVSLSSVEYAKMFLELGEKEQREYLTLAGKSATDMAAFFWSDPNKNDFFKMFEEEINNPTYENGEMGIDDKAYLLNEIFDPKTTKAALGYFSSKKNAYGRGTKDDIVIPFTKNRFNESKQNEEYYRDFEAIYDAKTFNFATFIMERYVKNDPELRKDVGVVARYYRHKLAKRSKEKLLKQLYSSQEELGEDFDISHDDLKAFLKQYMSIGYDIKLTDYIQLLYKTDILTTDQKDKLYEMALDEVSKVLGMTKEQLDVENNNYVAEENYERETNFLEKNIESLTNYILDDQVGEMYFSTLKKENFELMLDKSNLPEIAGAIEKVLKVAEKEIEKSYLEERKTQGLKDLQGAIEIPAAEATKVLSVSNKNFDEATKNLTSTLTTITDYFAIKNKDLQATNQEVDALMEDRKEFIIFTEKKSFVSNRFVGIVKGNNGRFYVIRKEHAPDHIASALESADFFAKETISSKQVPLIWGDGVEKASDLFDPKYLSEDEQKKLKITMAKGAGHGEGKQLFLSSVMDFIDYTSNIRNTKLSDQFQETLVKIYGEDSEENTRINLNRSVPSWIRGAIGNYNNGSFYRGFNQAVIDGNYKAMNDREIRTLRDFEEYFAIGEPLKENMVFYRGFRLDSVTDNSWFEDVVKNLKVGDVMGNRSFLSVSHTPLVPSYFADISDQKTQSFFMNIEVPKGTVVLPFGKNANFTSENEVLLNKDNAFYIKDIKEVSYNGQQVKIIDAILIDGDYKEFLSKDDKRPYYRVDAGKQLFIKRHMQGMELPFEFELNNLMLKNMKDIETVKEIVSVYNMVKDITKLSKEVAVKMEELQDNIWKTLESENTTTEKYNEVLGTVRDKMELLEQEFENKLIEKYGINESDAELIRQAIKDFYGTGASGWDVETYARLSGMGIKGERAEERGNNIANIILKVGKAQEKLKDILDKNYKEKIKDFPQYDEAVTKKLQNSFLEVYDLISRSDLKDTLDYTDASKSDEINPTELKQAYWYLSEVNDETSFFFKNLDLNVAIVKSKNLTERSVGGTAHNFKTVLPDVKNAILINADLSRANIIPLFPFERPFKDRWNVDKSPLGTITHELGHSVDYFLSNHSKKTYAGYEILREVFAKSGLDLREEIDNGKINKILSTYAVAGFEQSTQLGAREIFAEAFNMAFNPNTIFFDELQHEIISNFKKEVMRAFKSKLETEVKIFKFENGGFVWNKLEVPSPRYKYFEETDSSKIDLTNEKIKADSLYMKKNGIPFEKTSLGNAGVRLPKIYSDLRDGLVPDIKDDALIIDYGAGVGWKEQFKLREEAGIKNNVIPYDKYADEKIGDWTPVEDAIRKAKGEGKDVVIISSNVLNVIPIKEIFGENKDGAYVEDLVKEIERLANEYDVKAVITVYEGEPKNKYKPAIMGTGTYQSNMPLAYYTKFFNDRSKLSVGKYILYDPNKKYPKDLDIKDNSYGKVVGGNRYKYIGDNRILVTDAKTGEYKFTGIVDDWNGKFEPVIIKFEYPDGKFKVPSLAARQVYHSKHLFVDNPNAPQYQLSKARAEKIDAELKRLNISKKAIGYETKWDEYLKQMNLDAPLVDDDALKNTLNQVMKDRDFKITSSNLKDAIMIANVDGELYGMDGEYEYIKGKRYGRGIDHNNFYSSKELEEFEGRRGFYDYIKHIAVIVPETEEIFYGGSDKKILAAIKKFGYDLIKSEAEFNKKQGIEVNYMIFKDGAAGAKAAKIKERKKDIKKVKATFKNLNRNEELKVDVFETLKDEDKIRYMDYFNMQFNVKPLKKDIQNYNGSLNKAYRDIIATRASAGGAFWSSAALKELIPMQDGESYLFGKVDVQNTNVRYKDKRTGEQRQKTLVSSQVAYVMSQEKSGKRHLRVYHMSNENKFEFVEEIDGTMRTLSGRKEEEYYKKIEKNVEILEESEAVKIEKERVPANDPVTISGNLEKDYTNVINNLHNLTKKLVDQDNADKVGIDVPLSVRNILRPMRYHFNNIVRYKAYDIKQKLWGDTRFNQILDKKRMVNLKAQLSSKGLIEAMQQNTPLNIEGVNPNFVQNLRALWERAVQYKSKDTGVALDNEDFYMGIDTFYNKNLFQSQLFKLKEGAIDADLKDNLLENLKEEFIPLLETEEFLKQFFVDHTKTNRDKNGSAYLNHADIADYYYKDRAAYVKMYDGMEREIDDILGNIIKNAIKEEMNMSILDSLKTVAYAKFDSEDAKTLASIDSKTKLEISKEIDYLKMEAGRIVSRNVSSSKEVVEDYNHKSKLANAINKNPLMILIHDFMSWKYLASLNYLTEAPINSKEVNKGLRDYGIINNAQYLGKSFNYLGQYADMLKAHFHFARGRIQLVNDDVMQVKNLKDRELMRIYLNQKMMNEKDYSDFSKPTQFIHKLGQMGGSGQGFSDLQRKLLAEWSLYKEFGKGLKADIGKEKMKGLLSTLGIDETRFRDIQTALNVMSKDYLYELLFEKGEGDSEVENDIKRLFNNIVEDSGKDFDIFNRATGLEEHIMTKMVLMYKRYGLRMSTKIWRENTTTVDDDGIIYDNTRAGFDKTFTAENWIDNATDFVANSNFALNRGFGRIAIMILMGAVGLGSTSYYSARSQIDGFIDGDYFDVTLDLAMANLIDNAGITVGFGGTTPIASFITNIPYRYKLGARAGLSTGATLGYMALATVSPEVIARSIDLYSLKKNMPSNITTSSEKASFAYKSIYKQDGKRAQMKYDVPPLFLFIPRATGAIYQLMLKDDDLSSKASGIYDDSVDKELKAHIATENLITASEVARNHAVAILPSNEIDKLGIGYEEELNELSSSMKEKYIKITDYLGLDEKQKLIILHKLNDFNTEQEQEDFLMDQVPMNKRENFKN